MNTKYDAIIIGSGQAGNPLSQSLAADGQTVALIEQKEMGGTCINTGCTPTKTMIASAQVAHYARNAAQWGVNAGDVTVDLPAIQRRKDRVVGPMRASQEKKATTTKGLTLYRGTARFLDSRTVQVNGDQLSAGKIFIDTGARAVIPPIPGIGTIDPLTYESILKLSSVPDHLLILGGGYVGLEFGQMFRRFGAAVTVIQKGPHILPKEDKDITDELQNSLEDEGIEFILGADVHAARAVPQGVSVAITISTGNREITGSRLLVATGRSPNTRELNLALAGVAVDDHGFITVNDRLETNVPGIWALGDVNGGPQFTHISYNDFQIVSGNLLQGKKLSTADRLVPYAVYTDPQLGRVGLTEKQAREKGYELKLGTVQMTHVARAIERDETHGLMKLVVNAADDQILGAAILATEGGELVQILSTLMLARQPYTLLKGAIYIHPTLAEGFFSLMESVKPVE